MLKRRDVLRGAGSGLLLAGTMPRLAAAAGAPLVEGLPDGEYTTAMLEALPGKKPLIKLSYRPPNYETPALLFQCASSPPTTRFSCATIWPNPDSIDAKKWSLKIGGEAAASPFELSHDELQRDFEQVEIRAVVPMRGQSPRLSDPACGGRAMGRGRDGQRGLEGAGSRTFSPRRD